MEQIEYEKRLSELNADMVIYIARKKSCEEVERHKNAALVDDLADPFNILFR